MLAACGHGPVEDRESITRRDLPHWFRPDAAHFLTYRLKDSIPAWKLRQWCLQRDEAKRRGQRSDIAHKKFFASYDEFLDKNPGKSWLARSDVAAMIRENLYHHDKSLYHLIAYVVMSNHVHVVLQPIGAACIGRPQDYDGGDEISDGRSPLSRICHSIKSYTANEANKLLGRTGGFGNRSHTTIGSAMMTNWLGS